jgi:hypothetical protein
MLYLSGLPRFGRLCFTVDDVVFDEGSKSFALVRNIVVGSLAVSAHSTVVHFASTDQFMAAYLGTPLDEGVDCVRTSAGFVAKAAKEVWTDYTESGQIEKCRELVRANPTSILCTIDNERIMTVPKNMYKDSREAVINDNIELRKRGVLVTYPLMLSTADLKRVEAKGAAQKHWGEEKYLNDDVVAYACALAAHGTPEHVQILSQNYSALVAALGNDQEFNRLASKILQRQTMGARMSGIALVAICGGGHWSAALGFMPGEVHLFNSLPPGAGLHAQDTVQAVMRKFFDVWRADVLPDQRDEPANGVSVHVSRSWPKQTDAHNCGVFTCVALEQACAALRNCGPDALFEMKKASIMTRLGETTSDDVNPAKWRLAFADKVHRRSTCMVLSRRAADMPNASLPKARAPQRVRAPRVTRAQARQQPPPPQESVVNNMATPAVQPPAPVEQAQEDVAVEAGAGQSPAVPHPVTVREARAAAVARPAVFIVQTKVDDDAVAEEEEARSAAVHEPSEQRRVQPSRKNKTHKVRRQENDARHEANERSDESSASSSSASSSSAEDSFSEDSSTSSATGMMTMPVKRKDDVAQAAASQKPTTKLTGHLTKNMIERKWNSVVHRRRMRPSRPRAVHSQRCFSR